MADISALIAQSLGVVPSKQAEVSAAAEQKKQQLSGKTPAQAYLDAAARFKGQDVAGPDMSTGSAADIQRALLTESIASNQFYGDRSAERSEAETYGDIASGVGLGAVNSVLGIGALGLGVVSDELGTAAAEGISDFNKWGHDKQSAGLAAKRNAYGASNEVDMQDNAALYESDLAQYGAFQAGLNRMGRDAVDAGRNALEDPAILTDGIATGAGSLLVGGPASKALKAVGVAEKLAFPLAIGAMEGGGAYQGAVEASLAKGASRNDANAAGLIAAAVQAPVGAVTGKIVSKFETAPLKVSNLVEGLANIGRETLEEGLQSASGQFAQNVGVKVAVDPNQSLTEGVGEQTALGSLYGMGTAGVIQAPGLAGQAAVSGAKAAFNATVVPFMGREARIQEAAKAQSTEQANAAQAEVVAGAPTLRQELDALVGSSGSADAPKMAEYLNQFFDKVAFDPAEAANESPVVRAAVEGTNNRFDALKSVAAINDDPNASDQMKALAGAYLLKQYNEFKDLVHGGLNATVDKIDDNDPLLAKLREFEDTTLALASHPVIAPAMKAALEAAKSPAVAEQFSQASMEAPGGIEAAQQMAEAVTELTKSDPSSGNLEVLNTIRAHAVSGKIKLTPEQLSILTASSALIRGNAERVAAMKALGIKENARVSEEAQSLEANGDPDKEPVQSASAKAKAAIKAALSGDTELASLHLVDMRLLAEHFQNKVTAFNDNLASGRPDKKTGFTGIRKERRLAEAKWGPASPVWLNTGSETSIRLAQAAALDGKAIADMVNGLSEAFPDIAVKRVDPVALTVDPGLTKTAAEIMKERSRAKDKQPVQEAKPVEAPVQEKPQVDKPEPAKAEEEPAPVAEKPVKEEAPAKAEPALEKPVAEVVPDKKPAETAEKVAVEPEAKEAPFSKLIGAGKNRNWFINGFSAPDASLSRLVGMGDKVFSNIKAAVLSSTALANLTGKKNKAMGADLSASFGTVLGMSGSIVEVMEQRLAAFLSSTDIDKAREENPTQEWVGGRALNIVEVREDGTKGYNVELLQQAVLAGLSWLVQSQSRPLKGMDAEAVAEYAGKPVEQITPDMIDAFNSGVPLVQAAADMGAAITRFWGVKANDNAPEGLVKGVAEGVAKEIMAAMRHESVSLLDISPRTFADPVGQQDAESEDGAVEKSYQFVALKILGDTDTDKAGYRKAWRNMSTMPDAIEQAALVAPDPTRFVGAPSANVPKSQLRNSMVPLSDEQVEMVTNANQTAHMPNMPMVGLYKALGLDALRELFGAGLLDADVEAKTNVNTFRSMKGKNNSISGAFEAFESMVGSIELEAAELGKEAADVPVFFEHAVLGSGRLMVTGAYNPQASKLTREAWLPTRAVVDLTDPEMLTRFKLAVAQAWGEKVHKQSHEASGLVVDRMAQEDVSEVLAALDRFLDTGVMEDDFAQLMIEKFKGKQTAVALHASLEMARYFLASPEELKAFQTHLYVEADGMTNGPIMALYHLSEGSFTESWIELMSKGGLYLGAPGINARIFITGDKENELDVYNVSSTGTQANVAAAKKTYTGKVLRHSGLVDTLLKDLLKGASINDKGELEVGRDVTKNPQTVIVYGAGVAGVTNAVVKKIEEAFYAELTKAEQGLANNADDMIALVEELSSTFIGKSKDGEGFYVTLAREVNLPKDRSYTKYTLTKSQLKNLSGNVQFFFVSHMVKALEAVMDDTSKGRDALQQATAAQSLVMQHTFVKLISDKLATKSDDEAKNFLSKKEMREVERDLLKMFPLIKTDDQSFLAAKNAVSAVYSRARPGKDGKMPSRRRYFQFSRTLDGDLSSDALVRGPSNAGVAAIPMMVQGFGDALTIQKLTTGKDRPKRMLPVYDGIHFPLDTLKEDGTRANEAVYRAWQSNPLQAVSESFQGFLSNLSAKDASGEFSIGMSEELRMDLADLFLGKPRKGEPRRGMDPTEIQVELRLAGRRLANAARKSLARHRALARVQMSVDQMSSIEAAYEPNGKDLISLEGMSSAEQVMVLNQLMEEELAAIDEEAAYLEKGTKEAKAFAEKKTRNAKEVSAAPKATKTQAPKVTQGVDLLRMVRAAKASPDQLNLLKEVAKSLAKSGWEVVEGTADQLAQYAISKGQEPYRGEPGQTIKGYASLAEQRIYVASGESETLLHELIHASVSQTILAHYQGNSTPEVAEAIKRMETLKNEWLAMDRQALSELTPGQRQAYRDAVHQMTLEAGRTDRSKEENEAAALDEFLAWNLSNQDLIKVAQGTKVETRFARVVKRAVAALRSLIYGKGSVRGGNFYTALRFNAGILMNASPTLQSRSDLVFRAQLAGNATRTDTILKGLQAKINVYLNQHSNETINEMVSKEFGAVAVDVGFDLAQSFRKAGFDISHQDEIAFASLVAVLGTNMKLDAASLGRIGDLYAHVNKMISPTDFVTEEGNQAQESIGNTKVQALRGILNGQSIERTDAYGRSTLMPAFLALAMVNDEFRAVLSKMDLPKAEKLKGDSVDNIAQNIGNSAIDSLSEMVSGEGRNRPDVRSAIDTLTEHLAKTVSRDERMVLRATDPIANMIDKANDKVAAVMQSGVKKAYDKLGDLEAGATGKKTKALLEVAKLIVALPSEDLGKGAGEGWLSLANKSNAWEPLRAVLNDLVGRSESNAPIFDLIKPVRSFVQAVRQQAREFVPNLIGSKFKKPLAKEQWSHVFSGLAQSDLAALKLGRKAEDVLQFLSDDTKRSAEISRLEKQIEQLVGADTWKVMKPKAEQLAKFMNTREKGVHLLRNAEAVAGLYGLKQGYVPIDGVAAKVDQLVSLYAVDTLPTDTRASLASLVQDESEGMVYALEYIVGQRVTELAKASTPKARANHYKGYVPSTAERGVQLIVASDSEKVRLEMLGFSRKGDYKGSRYERRQGLGYYYAPLASRSTFSAGVMQNVRQTASGVDPVTGFTHDGLMIAGRIESPAAIRRIQAQMAVRGIAETEGLLPVFGVDGSVVAYERGVDPLQEELLKRDKHLGRMLGVWRGRQAEEAIAQQFNEQLVTRLQTIWEEGKGKTRGNEFINLFDADEQKKDPVMADAMSLLTPEALEHIKNTFGADGFMVRRDMINDAIGYRAASIGDAWHGTTRIPAAASDVVRKLAIGVWGKDAYRNLVVAEKLTQNLVSEARQTIVVRSVVVPVSNLVANIYQMLSRGVRLDRIAKDMPKKLAEVNGYVKRRKRLLELEADLRAAGDSSARVRQIQTEMKIINDTDKRMSIWPLIAAGEFSSISEAGSLEKEELSLYEGRLTDYIESKVDKLPKGLKTAVRYGLVTQDTALFQGMARAMEYGDFLGKAIRYDHLIEEKRLSQEEALASIGEEFVNYDRLPGRTRAYLENMGLLWFYNFKIRSVKVALAAIRENPLHALLVSLIPTPPFIGSVGTMLGDNVVAMAVDGSLPWSIGPDMGFRAHEMNPTVQLFDHVF